VQPAGAPAYGGKRLTLLLCRELTFRFVEPDSAVLTQAGRTDIEL
jgi:hypothetical protein